MICYFRDDNVFLMVIELLLFLLLFQPCCKSMEIEHQKPLISPELMQYVTVPKDTSNLEISPPTMALLWKYHTSQHDLNHIALPSTEHIPNNIKSHQNQQINIRQAHQTHWNTYINGNELTESHPFSTKIFNLNHPRQYWRCKLLTDQINPIATPEDFNMLTTLNAPEELLCSVFNRLYDQGIHTNITNHEILEKKYLLSFGTITWFGSPQYLQDMGLRSLNGIEQFAATMRELKFNNNNDLNKIGFEGIDLSNNHIKELAPEQLAIIEKNQLLHDYNISNIDNKTQEPLISTGRSLDYDILTIDLTHNPLSEQAKKAAKRFNIKQKLSYWTWTFRKKLAFDIRSMLFPMFQIGKTTLAAYLFNTYFVPSLIQNPQLKMLIQALFVPIIIKDIYYGLQDRATLKFFKKLAAHIEPKHNPLGIIAQWNILY